MKKFPPSFDSKLYKNYHKDLKNLNEIELSYHYNSYGIEEGRVASIITGRKDLISHISECEFTSSLEIGPFDCPVITGRSVKYFDVLNQEELIDRAKQIGRFDKIHNIPFINYVCKKGSLKTVNHKFDLILSCHVIEHQIDFIQHLNDVSYLLNDNGYYVIICPDKRYCFDHFIPTTSIAEIIDRNTNKSNNHSIKSVIEHRALTCHNDAIRHWAGDHGDYRVESNLIINSIKEYNRSIEKNEYIDVHSMQFTPNSFREIIYLLNSIKYINLSIEEIYPTIKNSNEFYIILKNDAKTP